MYVHVCMSMYILMKIYCLQKEINNLSAYRLYQIKTVLKDAFEK